MLESGGSESQPNLHLICCHLAYTCCHRVDELIIAGNRTVDSVSTDLVKRAQELACDDEFPCLRFCVTPSWAGSRCELQVVDLLVWVRPGCVSRITTSGSEEQQHMLHTLTV